MNTEWKLVPVEPADEQQLAGAQAIRMDTTPLNKMFTANRVYRDMIAAAPPAPTSHPIPTGATGEEQDERKQMAHKAIQWATPGNVMAAPLLACEHIRGMAALVLSNPAAGDALDVPAPEWMACESRRPWVTNSLKASAQKLRDKESRCRTAYTKDFYGIPARYVADAYAEAAAVFEAKLAAIAQQSQRKEA